MHRPVCWRFDCGDTVLDCRLHLFEGADLDLAYTLARHTKFVGQLSKRDRVVGQASALENAPLARVERAKQYRLSSLSFTSARSGERTSKDTPTSLDCKA